jgi:hypothetical protein
MSPHIVAVHSSSIPPHSMDSSRVESSWNSETEGINMLPTNLSRKSCFSCDADGDPFLTPTTRSNVDHRNVSRRDVGSRLSPPPMNNKMRSRYCEELLPTVSSDLPFLHPEDITSSPPRFPFVKLLKQKTSDH